MSKVDTWYLGGLSDLKYGYRIQSVVFGDAIAHVNKGFVLLLIGGGELSTVSPYWSADAWKWEPIDLSHPTSINAGWMLALTYGHGKFLLANINNELGEDCLYTSQDGRLWSEQVSPLPGDLICAAAGNNGYVVFGYRDAWPPSNSRRFAYLDNDCIQAGIGKDLDGIYSRVTYANGLYVAVGAYSAKDINCAAIATSTDGFAWYETLLRSVAPVSGIAFGRGTFVIVGDPNTILTSSDGIVWQEHSTPCPYYLKSIAYGNGVFVAVGDSGTIVSSRDGHIWWKCASGTDVVLYDVAFGNGVFVAVGEEKKFLVSSPMNALGGQGSAMRELTIRFEGEGRGCVYSTPGDILIDTTASYWVPEDSEWQFRATPAPNSSFGGLPVEYTFNGWTGGELQRSRPDTCRIKMDQDRTLVVEFSRRILKPTNPSTKPKGMNRLQEGVIDSPLKPGS